MTRLSPGHDVEEVEPCLPCWADRLGFERTVEVSEGDRLGFVILDRGSVEVMYQTRTSVDANDPALAGRPMGGVFLSSEVHDLDEVERLLDCVSPVVPRCATFWGADELIVRARAGNVVTFTRFAGAPGAPVDESEDRAH